MTMAHSSFAKCLVARMVKQILVEGFDDCVKFLEENKDRDVYVLFSGSKVNGKSWCPDCVVAEPVVEECIAKKSDDTVFIFCGVGERDFWKNATNPFRTDSRFKLKSVPTLMKWGQPKRLEESQCAKKELVEMLLEED